jgi:hypothetical protein
MTLRDLRPDLGLRKTALREERARLQARLREIDSEETAVDSLIQAEGRRFPEAAVSHSGFQRGSVTVNLDAYATSPMRRAVLTELADGKPRSHDEITKGVAAKGTSSAKGSLGRSVQGTLLSLKFQKVVKHVEGDWQLAQ